MKTELRIGNWVNVVDKDYQVTQILEKGVNCGLVGALYDIVKPIPLTEEWLERFGFEEKMIYNSIHYELGDFKVYIDIDNGLPSGYFDYHKVSMIGIKAELNHVHQLQNLYFALTGEELQTDETDQEVN